MEIGKILFSKWMLISLAVILVIIIIIWKRGFLPRNFVSLQKTGGDVAPRFREGEILSSSSTTQLSSVLEPDEEKPFGGRGDWSKKGKIEKKRGKALTPP